MIYLILFISFVLLFVYNVVRRKENKNVALSMGLVLFSLVALRSYNVGPDTITYIQMYLDPNYYNVNMREVEGFFKWWMSFWRSFHLNIQLYLVVCSIVSIGLVLFTLWKKSENRILSYTFFLVIFQWYFYLSGIRQSLAMGCFAFGTYLLSQNMDVLSFVSLRKLFRKDNLVALLFLIIAPLFHNTAIFADVMLLVALLSNKVNRHFYLWAIIISFIICLTAAFKDAEQILQSVYNFVSEEYEFVDRYGGYAEMDFIYDTGFYLILKNALPLNFISIFCLLICRRKCDVHERLFFWLVIVSNLFFYFPYMFRMKMYFYPAAAIAISNMLWPVMKQKRITLLHVALIVFVVSEAYVSFVNLIAIPEFNYEFFFSRS